MTHQRRQRDGNDAFERYIRRPNRRRLARVVSAFYEEVWKISLRVTSNEEDAADVCQDVFLSLLLTPPAVGSVRSARGYLVHRVLTLAARRRRAVQRRRTREIEAAHRLVRDDPTNADVEAVHEAIQTLPPRVRTAVELHYLAGYTHREIAELTGISERTVALDLQKGRKELALRLGEGASGLLPVLGTTDARFRPPPETLLENLMKVVKSGGALSPLASTRGSDAHDNTPSGGSDSAAASTLSSGSLLGGVLMSKKVAISLAATLIVFGGLLTYSRFGWRSTEGENESTESRAEVSRAPAGPSPKLKPKEEEASSKESVDVVAKLDRSLAGQVITAGGDPAADVRVEAYPLVPFGRPAVQRGMEPSQVGTDQGGRFDFGEPREDRWALVAWAADGRQGFAHDVRLPLLAPLVLRLEGIKRVKKPFPCSTKLLMSPLG